jgi:spore coat polysaccharide biosynthesis protein SpsF
MHIIAVIQARMSSTRLPGKVLMPLGSRTVLGQVLHQLSFSKRLTGLAVATSTDASDDALAAWMAQNHPSAPCLRGNLRDVLDRYYTAAQTLCADSTNAAIVRITADCPLLDPSVVDAVIERFLETGVDYCSNVHPPTFPDGLDVEVMTYSALAQAWREARLSSEREHVTPYIRNHTELFSLANVEHTVHGHCVDLQQFRWTLDTPHDYTFLQEIVQRLEQNSSKHQHNDSEQRNTNNSADSPITLQQVLELITLDNTLLDINGALKRNEGYAVSLAADALVSSSS